jgi:hypothetical protein
MHLSFALWFTALSLGVWLLIAGVFGPFPRLPVHPEPSSCAAWLDEFLTSVILGLAVVTLFGMTCMFWMEYLNDRRTGRS